MMNSENMNIEKRYNNWCDQLAKIAEPWSNAGLLKGLKNKYHKHMVAAILENQRLTNEITIKNNNGIEENQFLRISIPLTRRVFESAPFLNWVCVQPMNSPIDTLFMKSINGEWTNSAIIAKTRMLKTLWPHDLINSLSKPHVRLDHEAEIIELLALELADELCHEVIKDLCNNCNVETITLGDHQTRTLNSAISYGSNNLRRSLGHNQANWMIVSEKMYELIRSDPEYVLTELDELTYTTVSRVFHVGTFKNDTGEWALYCDRDFDENKILFGYHGDWQEAGYFYVPYVFLKKISKVDYGNGTFSYPLMTRYGKTIKSGGSNYYRLVTINNVVFTQDEPRIEESRKDRSFCAIRVQKGELATDSPD